MRMQLTFGPEQGSGAQAAGRNIPIRYTYSNESAAERRNCCSVNCSSFQKASGGASALICMRAGILQPVAYTHNHWMLPAVLQELTWLQLLERQQVTQ